MQKLDAFQCIQELTCRAELVFCPRKTWIGDLVSYAGTHIAIPDIVHLSCRKNIFVRYWKHMDSTSQIKSFHLLAEVMLRGSEAQLM